MNRGNIFLILAALVWGLGLVSQQAGMEYLGPLGFTAVRCSLGGLSMIPVVWLVNRNRDTKAMTAGEREAERRATLKGALVCAVALTTLILGQQYGLLFTSVGKAGFITALYIILVPILGIFLKKRVSFQIWISVVIAIIGLYLLCMKGSFYLGQGDFLVLICSLCFALHILVIDHFTDKVSGVKLSCIQFFVSGLLSSILMLLFEEPVLSEILAAWLPIVYGGVFSSGIAYTLQIIGQKGTDPTIASLILSLESVVSVLAGWILLGQALSPREILGCLLMFGAIILAQVAPDPNKGAKRDSLKDALP